MTTADARITEAGRKSRHLEIALPATIGIGVSNEETIAVIQESSESKGMSTLQEGIGKKRITREKK
jgi:hypothetical protein